MNPEVVRRVLVASLIFLLMQPEAISSAFFRRNRSKQSTFGGECIGWLFLFQRKILVEQSFTSMLFDVSIPQSLLIFSKVLPGFLGPQHDQGPSILKIREPECVSSTVVAAFCRSTKQAKSWGIDKRRP